MLPHAALHELFKQGLAQSYQVSPDMTIIDRSGETCQTFCQITLCYESYVYSMGILGPSAPGPPRGDGRLRRHATQRDELISVQPPPRVVTVSGDPSLPQKSQPFPPRPLAPLLRPLGGLSRLVTGPAAHPASAWPCGPSRVCLAPRPIPRLHGPAAHPASAWPRGPFCRDPLPPATAARRHLPPGVWPRGPLPPGHGPAALGPRPPALRAISSPLRSPFLLPSYSSPPPL
jgi:hypothetical protein